MPRSVSGGHRCCGSAMHSRLPAAPCTALTAREELLLRSHDCCTEAAPCVSAMCACHGRRSWRKVAAAACSSSSTPRFLHQAPTPHNSTQSIPHRDARGRRARASPSLELLQSLSCPHRWAPLLPSLAQETESRWPRCSRCGNRWCALPTTHPAAWTAPWSWIGTRWAAWCWWCWWVRSHLLGPSCPRPT